MRKTRRRIPKRSARRRQRDVLCGVMLSARQCATWLTLDELAKLTHYPPQAFPRSCGTCASRSMARSWWRSGRARCVRSCVEKISEPSGSTGSSARFSGSGWAGARDAALDGFRCKRP